MKGWPTKDGLEALVKESREHERTWALVRGLSNTILRERTMTGVVVEPRSERDAERIKTLERSIVKQRGELKNLNECRTYEAETERLLVEALIGIASASNPVGMQIYAQDALREHEARIHAPRPKPEEIAGDADTVVTVSPGVVEIQAP